jgi:hypothetical protein
MLIIGIELPLWYILYGVACPARHKGVLCWLHGVIGVLVFLGVIYSIQAREAYPLGL